MTSNLISQLKKLVTDGTSSDAIKKTAGLALAALETQKQDTLEGLIGDELNNFDPETGENALNDDRLRSAIRTFFKADTMAPQGPFINEEVNTDGNIKENLDGYLLDRIAKIITSCVEGNLSSKLCKDSFKVPSGKKLKKQKLNLKIGSTLLKALNFKIVNEENVLTPGTQKEHIFQSYESWIEDNKDNLPKNNGEVDLNASLEKVIKIILLTCNTHSKLMGEKKLVPVVIPDDNNEDEETYLLMPTAIGIVAQLKYMNQQQKYLGGLLPVKAKNVGLFDMVGGAGLAEYYTDNDGKKDGLYLSYVDEQVDANKGFYTGKVLSDMFKEYSKVLEKKGITINDAEKTQIQTELEKLQKDEYTVAQITATIEKYIALKKYFPINDDANSIETMQQLLLKHADKLKYVEKKRTAMGNIILVMARQHDFLI